MYNYSSKFLFIFAVAMLLNKQIIAQNSAPNSTQIIQENRKNGAEQLKKPYVIIISADGFRHDYAEKYNAKNLLALSRKGVRAASLIPSFPTLTFPNHYTLATGLYPAHHGIVNNNFLDKKSNRTYAPGNATAVRDGYFYGGTPIWVLAEEQKMLAATYYWVGSEASIKNISATYSYNFVKGINLDERIQTVIDWINLPEEKRPHLINFYIDEPDHSGHTYGPETKEVELMVKSIDDAIYKLTEALKPSGLDINYLFVSDHGMTKINQEMPLKVENLDLSKVTISAIGAMTNIHVKDVNNLQEVYKTLKANENNYKVYLKSQMPFHLKYSIKEDIFDRIGDIILLADWPFVFSINRPNPGYHGFDPSLVKDMHAVFMAWGPAFKENIKIDSFENVHIYPLIAKILGLQIEKEIDGDLKVLESTLK